MRARRTRARRSGLARRARRVERGARASDRGARRMGTREMTQTIDTGALAVVSVLDCSDSSTSRPSCASGRGREREVALATAACHAQRGSGSRRSERFRDKALQAWERAAAADEQKQIDELATLRHVAALRESAQRSMNLISTDVRHRRHAITGRPRLRQADRRSARTRSSSCWRRSCSIRIRPSRRPTAIHRAARAVQLARAVDADSTRRSMRSAPRSAFHPSTPVF